MANTRLGDVIRQIARDRGDKALTNTPLMQAMFLDLAPTMKREKELLRAFLMCDGANKLLEARDSTAANQKAVMESMVKTLCTEQSITEDAARHVCAEFYYGITGRNWVYDVRKPAPTPAPAPVPANGSRTASGPKTGSATPKTGSAKPLNLDVYTTAVVKNLQTYANRRVSVSVDGQTVNVVIPETAVAGQQIKFAGKGKKDPRSGSCGDLYVTVQFQNNGQGSSLKTILITAAVMLCLFVGGSMLFGSEDSGQAPGSIQNNTGNSSSQGHTHVWKDATCTDPRICTICDATSGSAAGHKWAEAPTSQPETCKICGVTRGQPLQNTEEQTKQNIMSQAESYVSQGEYRNAIQILDTAWDVYKDQRFFDAAAQYRQEFAIYNASVIAAGKLNSVLRYADGGLLAVGDSARNELDANYWTDTVMIGVGDRHTVALKEDGTVLVVGEYLQDGARSWKNVIMISAGDVHTVGLMKDGTVKSVGYSETDHNQGDVDTLMQNAGSNRIVAISAGHRQTLALLETGRVVACGDNSSGANNVTGWRNIAAIYAGSDYSAGLKTDGTVVVTKNSWDVSGWTDIVTLAAGDYYLLGLKEDGTVLAVGKYGSIDVSGWKNIVHIAAGHDHAVAVDEDGDVLCTGSNGSGQHFEKGTNING